MNKSIFKSLSLRFYRFQVQAIADHHHPLQGKINKVRFQDPQENATDNEMVDFADTDSQPTSPPPTDMNDTSVFANSSIETQPSPPSPTQESILKESPPPYTPGIAQSNSFDKLLAIKP